MSESPRTYLGSRTPYTPPTTLQPPASRSPKCQAAKHRAELFARDDTVPILICGESGTGKTALARQIHDWSPRRHRPFLWLDLATLDDGVAASELFGHVAGAFTDARQARAGQFASANGGTLFLDEIGKTSLRVQGMLLRAIEYGEIKLVGGDRVITVNVRIIAATNVDLAERVSQGSFLPDLSARLAMWKVVIPPLRERRADIPGLVEEMLTRHAGSCGYGDCPPAVNPRLMEAIVRAEWPDNLRQLEGAVHRLMLLAEGAPELTLAHCDDVLSFLCDHVSPADIKREQALQALEAERSYLGAARRLGVDPKTVRRRLRED